VPLKLDTKQHLAYVAEHPEITQWNPGEISGICRAALAEIERLEKGNQSDRITRLEALVCMLARGLLQHEYSKDFCRHGTEEACKALANEDDLEKAVSILASNR